MAERVVRRVGLATGATPSATRFTDAWTTFLSVRKNWGYRQDQLSSTHPVYCEMPDVEAVEVNFDGITYAKGASVIKQLVAYVGHRAVRRRPARLLRRSTPGATPPSTTCSPRWRRPPAGELREFAAAVAGDRAGQHAAPGGRRSAPTAPTQRSRCVQEAPADYPTLRTHRIGVGLYDLVDGRAGPPRAARARRRRRARPPIAALAGVRAADVLLLNDDDLTYAKLRLDERSMATVVEHIARLRLVAGPGAVLGRGLGHGPRRRAGRPRLRRAGLRRPARRDATSTWSPPRCGRRQAALDHVRRPGLGADRLGACWPTPPGTALAAAEPGSGFQLAWARAFVGAARAAEDLADAARLAGRRRTCPTGLAIDTELRWTLLQALVANGAADAEPRSRPSSTATGPPAASGRPPLAHALIPTAEAKAAVWRRADRRPRRCRTGCSARCCRASSTRRRSS